MVKKIFINSRPVVRPCVWLGVLLLALLMPAAQTQPLNSAGKASRALVRNEQASVLYKLDLLKQYWLESQFLAAAAITRPSDLQLKGLAKFVDFQHKVESHRLTIDLVSYAFSQKTQLVDFFFKTVKERRQDDLDLVVYARVFNEIYFQADLSREELLELRQLRDQTLRYQTLMQATNPLASMNSPKFKELNLADVKRRWERAKQFFDKDPQSNEWVRMYQQLDIEVPPRTVVLTFDDGPHPVHTPAILDVLKRYKIKAMFFQLGSIFDGDYIGAENVKTRLAIQERLLAEGHVVANHTYSHPKLSDLSFEGAAKEIHAAQKFITASVKSSSAQTRFFRPPYGDSDYKTLLAVDDARLYPLFWNIDSRDWEAKSPQELVQRTVKVADDMDGGIVLLHDIHEVTAQGLAELIEALRAKRFGFAIWNGQTFVRQAD